MDAVASSLLNDIVQPLEQELETNIKDIEVYHIHFYISIQS